MLGWRDAWLWWWWYLRDVYSTQIGEVGLEHWWRLDLSIGGGLDGGGGGEEVVGVV